MRIVLILVLAELVTSVVTAAGPRSGHASGRVSVVAAENVYGDIAAQIGGPRVHVTSILSNPNADPHLYEPGTLNGLAVAEAQLVIQNGLGYDAFMQRLEGASPSKHRVVVTIADALGIHGRNANPHLWYDIQRLGVIVAAVANGLSRVDAAGEAVYASGAGHFLARCAALRAEVRSIRSRFAGTPVAYTEPVPGYLLAAAHLRNLAPTSFTRAIEDGSEPSPAAVAAMTGLIDGRTIKALLYNSQTISPVTERIRAAAVAHQIPVVGVSETLPPRLDYQQWQLRQARALETALAR
jgi:zinc/manganese transport system substrate-binding protein